MSGGVAYVYKLRADRINHEALAAGELKLESLDEKDAAALKALLERQATEAHSNLAARLLADFENELAHFTRVLPRDYANVLSIRERAASNGTDPDSEQVWAEILEVTNG
jgi:glutamate synthase (NADPH/NADH) large chain